MRQYSDHRNSIEVGFTLIEVVIVITILGILAGVAIFAVNGIPARADITACKVEVTTLNTAIQAYYAKTDPPSYPPGPIDSLGAQLKAAGLLSENSVIPGATAGHTPLYAPLWGRYMAACP